MVNYDNCIYFNKFITKYLNLCIFKCPNSRNAQIIDKFAKLFLYSVIMITLSRLRCIRQTEIFMRTWEQANIKHMDFDRISGSLLFTTRVTARQTANVDAQKTQKCQRKFRKVCSSLLCLDSRQMPTSPVLNFVNVRAFSRVKLEDIFTTVICRVLFVTTQ